MNKRIMSLVLLAALAGTGSNCLAEDGIPTRNYNDPLLHPVHADTDYEVKEGNRERQANDRTAEDARAAYQQANDSYEKSLKENGAKSEVTADAKKRALAARKEMLIHNKKTSEANQEAISNEMKTQQ